MIYAYVLFNSKPDQLIVIIVKWVRRYGEELWVSDTDLITEEEENKGEERVESMVDLKGIYGN